MMIISDASPIIALYNIGHLSLLKLLYHNVTITDIVQAEVEIELPSWIVIDSSYELHTYQSLAVQLDRGEASSIALALKHEASTLIIDERKGRKIANSLGIEVIGLLGIIVKAKKEGKIEKGMPIVQALQNNGFRVSDKLVGIISMRLNE